MTVQSDTEGRITEAANKLYEESGRDKFPTVDAVRRAARADMNTTTLVMKSWRRQQTVQPETVRSTVPEPLRNEWLERHESTLVILWESAQALANEALESAQSAWEIERQEAEKLLAEASQAYDDQTVQLNHELDEHNADIERADDAERRAAGLAHDLTEAQSAASAEKNRLDEKIAGLESQLSDAKDREKTASEAARATADKLSKSESAVESAQKLADERKKSLDEAHEELNKTTGFLSKAKNEAGIAQKLADERKASLDEARASNDKAVSDLREDWKDRVASVESVTNSLRQELEACRAELNNAQIRTAQIESDYKHLEQENASLKSKPKSAHSK